MLPDGATFCQPHPYRPAPEWAHFIQLIVFHDFYVQYKVGTEIGLNKIRASVGTLCVRAAVPARLGGQALSHDISSLQQDFLTYFTFLFATLFSNNPAGEW